MGELSPLRPLQQKAIDGLRNSLRTGHKRPIIQAPTGFGKTVIGAHIVSGALAKNKRVAFVVPLLSLIDQTFERLRENGVEPSDMGVIQGNHPWHRPHAPVQICSVQTLNKRGVPEVDFVVVDEVHLRFKAVDDWIAAEPAKIFVGLSATPWSRGLAESWDDLLIPTTTAELIREGFLTPIKAFAPSHPDLTGVKIVAGDYHEGQLSERMSGARIVADVVETWCAKAMGLPTLVFAVDRAHAMMLHEQFESCDVRSAYVDANTDREERAMIARRLSNGDISVICSIGTMTTGVDMDIRCISFCRPTRSDILYTQCIGRGLRTAPGKTELLLLDHSDTTLALGMVTEIHHDKLRKGKRAEADEPIIAKPKLPKQCPRCPRLIPVGAMECPSCGFKPKIVSSVVCDEGELVEIGMAGKLKRKTNAEMTWEEKARFIGELRGYAQEMLYKSGWVANKYKERCGVWPNDPRVNDAPTLRCGPATRSWIRASQIRWAKTRNKRNDDEMIAASLAAISGHA